MKTLTRLFIAAMLVAGTSAFAQLETPQPSPQSTISQKVGLTDIEVNYSRPGVKDRTIFGDLLAYGDMWRLGANASTKLTVSSAVNIGGVDVPAGTYALYAIPEETEWTMVIHKNTEHWGVGDYKKEEDLGRFQVKVQKLNEKVESLTIDFQGFTTEGADMVIRWENTGVSFPIKTDAVKMVDAKIKEVLIDGPGAGTYYQAARFYLENDRDLNQALSWIDTAVKKRPDAFWYIHQKAKIQAKLGMKKEAIATATTSMDMAKKNEQGDFGYVKNNETLIADIKAGKYDMKKK